VERAAKRNWSVELWSWEQGLSPKIRAMRDAYPKAVALSLLDLFYWKLTFIKGGSYSWRGITSTVPNRVFHDWQPFNPAFVAPTVRTEGAARTPPIARPISSRSTQCNRV
jgi:hypothetical protein